MSVSVRQQGFIILAVLVSFAVSATTVTYAVIPEHGHTTKLTSSHKPRLYTLYESHDGLILICIGINEHNNVTWFWRNADDVVEPVVNSHNQLFVHKLNYWMLFRNQLQSTSRLELRGSMQVYNNTHFICSKDGEQVEYKFVFKDDGHTRSGPNELEATSPSHGSVTKPSSTGTKVQTTSGAKYERYPQMTGPPRHTLYVGDVLALQCEYRSPNSPIAWNLEYSNSKRDVYLSQTDLEYHKNKTEFFSLLIIHSLRPEHNNTKVICENEEGRAEYYISLSHKKHLNELCDSNNDCGDLNTRCKYGFCTCMPFYVYGRDYNGLDVCLKIRKHNEHCSFSSQCRKMNKKMTCDRNICRCQPGYFFNGNRCAVMKRNLDDSCSFDENCAFTYGTCRNVSTGKACVCQDGFRPSRGKCISQRILAEEHMFAVGFLTAIVILAVFAIALMVFALRSARVCYMQRKGRHYREVIMGEQQLSISSRVARYAPSKVDIVTQEKVDAPCGPSDLAFTTIYLTPSTQKRETKPGEDKTVCVPETIPFIHAAHSSSC